MYDFQRASMWKRISAALFDGIFLSIVVVGCALLLSIILNYDGQSMQFEKICDTYEAQYNVDFDVDYDTLTEEERAKYDEAQAALYADVEAIKIYSMLTNYIFVIVTFSILLGYLLIEFVMPLIFKNGQTIGKKIFGVAVMREDGVKLSPTLLFVRTVLGKYTLETMVPVFILVMIFLGMMGIVGVVVIAAILIAQIVLLIVTKARTPLHDKLAHTVTVDFTSQMIFETTEEMIEYKKRIHAELVESEREIDSK